ncbi:MAG: hypothetical protein JXX29_14300 [Deltaproteobacteria bacterium]|nr:hypothetical protein [Deltaproteobacteria bacterium]MBN2672850.1 hypothetical protein [Deltaproteobacteria bacterium]
MDKKQKKIVAGIFLLCSFVLMGFSGTIAAELTRQPIQRAVIIMLTISILAIVNSSVIRNVFVAKRK